MEPHKQTHGQSNKDKLLNVLARHIGQGQGIGVEALAARVGVVPRQVRGLITDLRLEGIAVCGTPRHGYYIAGSADELEETCRFLRSRAMCSLTLESRLRKMPLPGLLGQLALGA